MEQKRLISEFLKKNWSRCRVQNFLRRLRMTGSIERAPGSGRPRMVRTGENVHAVEELVQSQEDRPQSHLSTRQISSEFGLCHLVSDAGACVSYQSA